MTDDSLTPRPPSSQGRVSPATVLPPQSTLSPPPPRSPSLNVMVASPPHSPRLPGHASHHGRTPSFSSTFNMVDLLSSQSNGGAKPAARDWTTITLGELVHEQKLVFVDGDTPVETACQVCQSWHC